MRWTPVVLPANASGGLTRISALILVLAAGLWTPSAARSGPIGIIAAGDSLWFFETGTGSTATSRPSIPIGAQVRDMALQVHARYPEYLRDVRAGVATSKGLMLWHPNLEEPVWLSLGDVVDVEASDSLWVALVRSPAATESPGYVLRVASGSRMEELRRPESWATELPLAHAPRALQVERVSGAWLQAVGPAVPEWKDLPGDAAVTVALTADPLQRRLYVTALPPFSGSTAVLVPSATERRPSPQVWFCLSLFDGVAVLDPGAAQAPSLYMLGFGRAGEEVWRGSTPVRIAGTAAGGLQGRHYRWILAAEDSLHMLKVPGPRLWQRGPAVIEMVGGRRLAGPFHAVCTDRGRWAAVAYGYEGGKSVIDLFDATNPAMPPIQTCFAPGSVRALGIVHSQAVLTREEFQRRYP